MRSVCQWLRADRNQGTGTVACSNTRRGVAPALPVLPVQVNFETKDPDFAGLQGLLIPDM